VLITPCRRCDGYHLLYHLADLQLSFFSFFPTLFSTLSNRYATSNLKRNLINTWSIHGLHAGGEWVKAMNAHLNAADIILLMVSPNFLSSDYCNEVEVKRAMERSEAGEAIVIPILLRPVNLAGTPFRNLKPLPEGGRPVTNWKNRDNAFSDISLGIQYAAETILEKFHFDNNQFKPTPLIQEPQGIFEVNYLYDIVLAFALEDCSYAETLTSSLRAHGMKVFCYSEGINKEMLFSLLGKNLHTYLFDLNQWQWRICVSFLSQYYAAKLSNHEREAVLVHALQEQGGIFPIHLDETAFPDINEDATSPVKWHETDIEEISERLVRKVEELSRIIPDH
jgi:TIR domain